MQACTSIQFSISPEKSRYIFKHMTSKNLRFLVDIKVSHPFMSLKVGNFQECGSHNIAGVEIKGSNFRESKR